MVAKTYDFFLNLSRLVWATREAPSASSPNTCTLPLDSFRSMIGCVGPSLAYLILRIIPRLGIKCLVHWVWLESYARIVFRICLGMPFLLYLGRLYYMWKSLPSAWQISQCQAVSGKSKQQFYLSFGNAEPVSWMFLPFSFISADILKALLEAGSPHTYWMSSIFYLCYWLQFQW